jgi:diaminopimelate decarboxylase
MLSYGAGFDVASKGEIKTVLKLGTSPDRIVLSNSVKKEEDIAYAKKKGVKLTTADTLDELIKI